MPLPNPNVQLRYNVTRVLDVLEYILKNRLPTVGAGNVVVDRSRDPRKLGQDVEAEFDAKGTLVRLKPGDQAWLRGREPGATVGAVRRKRAEVELICVQLYTDAHEQAGLTADQLQDWLRHDVEWALEPDDEAGTDPVIDAAAALNTTGGPWGGPGTWGPAPSCIGLAVDEVLAGPLNLFPQLWQVIRVGYDYDEHWPGGVAGTP